VPAAAVIPALIAYIKVVAVKKLVVGFQEVQHVYMLVSISLRTVTVRKLECFKQAYAGIH
jgi:hypothetical protein